MLRSKPTSPPDARLVNQHTHKPPPGSVWIGRGTPWGNPFVLGRDGERGEILYRYRKWLEEKPPRYFDDVRRRLAGKVLVCVCAPKACHGEFLLAIIDGREWPDHGMNQLRLFE